MSTIVTRAGKGSPLTNNEVDSNFVNLNSDKVETVTSVDGSVALSRVGTSVDLSVVVSLDELQDVQVASVANNQVLQYETSTTLWKNKTLTTSSITEGTNLYYTDARVRAAISGTAPVSFNSTTGAISMAAATSSVNGFLTSSDWSTFNAKQDALVSGSNIKTINSTSLLGPGDISIPVGDPAGTAVAMAIALG